MIPTIVKYILQGLTGKAIADIMGCSEGYISQVKAREDFQELVEKAKIEIIEDEKEKAKEKRYETLEDRVIAHLEDTLSFAEFSEATKLLEILNRRRSPMMVQAPAAGNTDNSIKIVNLQLPASAVPELVLNGNNEVIGIGETSIAPMSSGGVRTLFAQLKMRQAARLVDKAELEDQEKATAPAARRVTSDQM